MKKQRRDFIKKALGATTVVAVGGVHAIAKGPKATTNGVVIGKTSKKEVLYKRTTNWEAYYKVAF